MTTTRTPRRAQTRTAFSLLEVLLAASILLGAVIVLGELANVATRSARAANEFGVAQALCRTKLNEIVVGAERWESVDDGTFADNAEWTYRVEIEPLAELGLARLRVTVSRRADEGGARPREYQLVRLAPDPTALKRDRDPASDLAERRP